MFKFIKSLFVKKEKFTLDDLNLSDRVELKLVDEGDYWYKVYFIHPLYNEIWPLPSRRTATYSRWTILKRDKIKKKDILLITSWNKYDIYERFRRVNDLKIYFNSLEKKYNELHKK